MNQEINVDVATDSKQTEERLTVEVPTEIQAGRGSDDCYPCSSLD